MRNFFSLLFLLVIAWVGGLLWFVACIPENSVDPDVKSDAIVVLTGGASRLERGIELLEQGKADVLFITGVGGDGSLKAVLAHASRVDSPTLEALKEKIKIGNKAKTTFGNSEEVKTWIAAKNIHSIRLVTANYHMPRSLLIFSHAMPDVTFIADPASPKHFTRERWLSDPNSLRLTFSEYNKYLLSGVVILFHALV